VNPVRLSLAVIGASLIAYAISDHPFYGGVPGFGQVQFAVAAIGIGLAICALSPPWLGGRVLLLAVASLCTLGVVELVGEMLLTPRYRPIFQVDDRLIFKFTPSRRSVMTHSAENGGQTVWHRINSHGFRGDELRSLGEMTRVVVYGDSFIHAFYSLEEETFCARLRGLLVERLRRPVEVVNAGVSSYGPDQIALKMERELPWLKPDLAIVAIFAGNDYGDLLRNKMFRLGADNGLAPNGWHLDPKVRELLEANQRESILVRAVRGTLGSLRAKAVRDEAFPTLEFLLDEAEREYQDFVVRGDNRVTNTHIDYYSADVAFNPKSASARYKVLLMGAVIAKINDVARAHGVPLVLLLIPHPADVTEGGYWGAVDRNRFPHYDGRNQIAPLEDIARRLDLPYVSLYDVYRSAGAAELYFRGGDDHWNATGQALGAQTTAKVLEKLRLRQPSPR
jgi:hypothetical protein